MKNLFRLAHCGIFAMLLGFTAKTNAIVLRPLSIEELAQKAEVIVQGVVSNKTAFRDSENRICTRIEIQVLDVLKGKTTNAILSVVHGGGTIGNEREEISGQVQYNVGDEFLGFFVANPRGELVTIGLSQGKFDIWQRQPGGEKFAKNIFHGTARTQSDTSLAATSRSSAADKQTPLKLTELKARIQQTNP